MQGLSFLSVVEFSNHVLTPPWRLVLFAGDYTDCGRIRKNLLRVEALAIMRSYSQWEHAARVRGSDLERLDPYASGHSVTCRRSTPLWARYISLSLSMNQPDKSCFDMEGLPRGFPRCTVLHSLYSPFWISLKGLNISMKYHATARA